MIVSLFWEWFNSVMLEEKWIECMWTVDFLIRITWIKIKLARSNIYKCKSTLTLFAYKVSSVAGYVKVTIHMFGEAVEQKKTHSIPPPALQALQENLFCCDSPVWFSSSFHWIPPAHWADVRTVGQHDHGRFEYQLPADGGYSSQRKKCFDRQALLCQQENYVAARQKWDLWGSQRTKCLKIDNLKWLIIFMIFQPSVASFRLKYMVWMEFHISSDYLPV